jgi:DNA-binding beta-propeller fold protein YncE
MYMRSALLVILGLIGTGIHPAVFWLSSDTLNSYEVVHGWPVLAEDYILGQASGVGVDSHNRVFVFHRADVPWMDKLNEHPIPSPTILSFDGETGRLLNSWGANVFLNPHGLAVDHDDNIWVTDCGRQQVLKFTNDGRLLMTVGEEGKAGLDGQHFNQPTDIAVASDGSFYVADGYVNSRVAKFASDGKFLFDWGRHGSQPGEFDTPHSISLDGEGRVYVADRANSRIQVFKPDGTFLYQWKNSQLGRPWAIRLGSDNRLYVVDGGDMNGGPQPKPPDRGYIMQLDLRGNILQKWSRFGNYDGQLLWGHAVATGRDGAVYVCDVRGRRVQKFVPRVRKR